MRSNPSKCLSSEFVLLCREIFHVYGYSLHYNLVDNKHSCFTNYAIRSSYREKECLQDIENNEQLVGFF